MQTILVTGGSHGLGKANIFNNRLVSYIETMQVKDDVECDVYSFAGDENEDLVTLRFS